MYFLKFYSFVGVKKLKMRCSKLSQLCNDCLLKSLTIICNTADVNKQLNEPCAQSSPEQFVSHSGCLIVDACIVQVWNIILQTNVNSN